QAQPPGLASQGGAVVAVTVGQQHHPHRAPCLHRLVQEPPGAQDLIVAVRRNHQPPLAFLHRQGMPVERQRRRHPCLAPGNRARSQRGAAPPSPPKQEPHGAPSPPVPAPPAWGPPAPARSMRYPAARRMRFMRARPNPLGSTPSRKSKSSPASSSCLKP